MFCQIYFESVAKVNKSTMQVAKYKRKGASGVVNEQLYESGGQTPSGFGVSNEI